MAASHVKSGKANTGEFRRGVQSDCVQVRWMPGQTGAGRSKERTDVSPKYVYPDTIRLNS